MFKIISKIFKFFKILRKINIEEDKGSIIIDLSSFKNTFLISNDVVVKGDFLALNYKLMLISDPEDKYFGVSSIDMLIEAILYHVKIGRFTSLKEDVFKELLFQLNSESLKNGLNYEEVYGRVESLISEIIKKAKLNVEYTPKGSLP